MPPALSDYDSESESDSDHNSNTTLSAVPTVIKDVKYLTPASTVEGSGPVEASPKHTRNSATPSIRVGQKRNRLMSGIDESNIIIVEDSEDVHPTITPPASSASTSSSSTTTRRQVHGSQKSELCYDQKYHPMDDYLRPYRAAQRRAMYKDTDISASVNIDYDSGSETEDTIKRMKLSLPSLAQRTRRSSRSLSSNVNYRTDIHPQDAEINELNDGNDDVVKKETKNNNDNNNNASRLVEDSNSGFRVVEDPDSEEGEDEDTEDNEAVVQTVGPFPGLVRYPLVPLIDASPSASPHGGTAFNARIRSHQPSLRNNTRIQIFEDPSSAPDPFQEPMRFDDDDKENGPNDFDDDPDESMDLAEGANFQSISEAHQQNNLTAETAPGTDTLMRGIIETYRASDEILDDRRGAYNDYVNNAQQGQVNSDIGNLVAVLQSEIDSVFGSFTPT